MKCKKNFEKAIKKIEEDEKYRPTCCIGPTGPKGEQGLTGPTGPAGDNLSRAAYIVTFNEDTKDGIAVLTNERVPLERVELDLTNLVTVDSNTIQFNTAGYYQITIIMSVYSDKTDTQFDSDNDFVSIGLREINTDNIYIGASEWSTDKIAKQMVAHGIIVVPNPKNIYELVNISKKTIYLHNPDIRNIQSISYFTNSVVTIVIDYLGRQDP